MDVVLEILKWTALVFIAGLVGQVGKSLTLWLMGRAKEGRSGVTQEPGSPPQPSQEPGSHGDPCDPLPLASKKALKAAAKIEKKAAKDAAKEAKKS